ncbi:hypothetical protein SAMD00023353_3700750 [Rosellinia necatrix]|uniref:Uncharacterized protein n=1 Tax=Rosellinia necatrix TaxID=77044 RepID=A0A1S8AA43_ROSNE|nr:hypothetical protein SAMD00023353_3700750 [Rosellinia necatrix]
MSSVEKIMDFHEPPFRDAWSARFMDQAGRGAIDEGAAQLPLLCVLYYPAPSARKLGMAAGLTPSGRRRRRSTTIYQQFTPSLKTQTNRAMPGSNGGEIELPSIRVEN